MHPNSQAGVGNVIGYINWGLSLENSNIVLFLSRRLRAENSDFFHIVLVGDTSEVYNHSQRRFHRNVKV